MHLPLFVAAGNLCHDVVCSWPSCVLLTYIPTFANGDLWTTQKDIMKLCTLDSGCYRRKCASSGLTLEEALNNEFTGSKTKGDEQ